MAQESFDQFLDETEEDAVCPVDGNGLVTDQIEMTLGIPFRMV